MEIKKHIVYESFPQGVENKESVIKLGDYQLFFLWKTVKNKKRNQQAKIAC